MTNQKMNPKREGVVSAMTDRTRTRRYLPGAAALLASLCGACTPPLPTTTQDVRDYVRNAQAHAAVRRLDDIAQNYVDEVYHAFAAYKKAFDPIEKLADEDALWPMDGDQWRDAEKVAERKKTVDEWRADKPDPEKPDSKTRPELLQALSGAIDNVPALPDLTPASDSALVAYITKQLDAGAMEPKYDAIADDYATLLGLVIAHKAALDADGKGLAFKDEQVNAQAANAWRTLHDLVVTTYTKEDLKKAEADLQEDRTDRADTIKEKQSLRSKITSDKKVLRRYRELEMLLEYYDARIHSAEADLKRIKKAIAAG